MCDKTTRLYLLTVAAGLYEHVVGDAAMRDALNDHGVGLSLQDIRAEYEYLAALNVDGRPVAKLAKNGGHDMWALGITRPAWT